VDILVMSVNNIECTERPGMEAPRGPCSPARIDSALVY